MKLRWSRQAQQDLLKIGRYIAKDKPAAARKWVEVLRKRAQQAAQFPNSGRIVPEYGQSSIREVVQGNYRIVYRVKNESVEVITVFEAHQLFPQMVKPKTN